MRVLMLSKACIVGIYQRKLEMIARHGVELLTLVPPSWKDERGELLLERTYTEGYRLETLPIAFNGNFHLHFYPGLGERIRAFRPDIVHIDEEPYNLSSWQALVHARRAGAKTLFFSWQNICRDYPFPFKQGERWVLNTIDYALAGTESAAQVWRAKGYTGRMRVIPQFGVDAELFTPEENRNTDRSFTVGYFGRLVPEKGVDLLLRAVAQLLQAGLSIGVLIVGGGPEREGLAALAQELGLSIQVHFQPQQPSTAMPGLYRQVDALVLPSLTRPNWKEQFGRVLIEAMASGVPVVGSNSGAIPDIIGDAGLIFPEGDISALADSLRQLATQLDLQASLRQKGRARILSHFTHDQVAAATVAVYHELTADS